MKRKAASIVSTVVIGGALLVMGGVGFANNVNVNNPLDQKLGINQSNETSPGKMGGAIGEERPGPMDQTGMRNQQDMMKTLTESLVNAGIITQETAEKMVSFYEEKNEERKAEMEKTKSMTEEARKSYYESRKEEKPEGKSDFTAEMVAAGILTQAQAEAIHTYQKEQMGVKMNDNQEKRQEEIEKQLASLVDANTITKAQAGTILVYLEQEKETRKAETEKSKDMTEEERKAYFESKKGAKPEEGAAAGPMQKLVEDGTLTQAQADAVAKVLYPQRLEGEQPGRPEMKTSNN
ncbi:hypothetical protein [Geosporobacter ferrireducens]|uniref:hypothetical protein n=1 Tax=Geosporobacter ferrireducens TaxID=1424294 RepID=UPI00139CD138|nr:hypothetical protein [Geosporobacter ferrireducens]MTI54249.1 hypothetical protein [Geosporobacter ferrireducens]